MRKRILWWCIALLLIVASGLWLLIPGSPVLAKQTHHTLYLVGPTATPDASQTLQMAQQEEVNIQSILGILNLILVLVPIFVALAAIILSIFGIREFRDLEKKKLDLEKQAENLEKQAKNLVEDINQIKREAADKKMEIGHTQEALVYLALGDRLSNQNDTRNAIDAYKKAGTLLPNDPQINYVLGRIYSGFGYYDEAIKAFEATLAVKQDYPEAEMELGLAYRRKEEYQDGSNATVAHSQDYTKAIEHLQRAIALRPNYDDALSTLGGLYRRKKEYEKALEYYEKAYYADRSSSYALGNMASLAWHLRKLDKARNSFMLTELMATERIQTPHSETYWDYYDLALAQLVLGKTADANKNYAKAIGQTPGVVQFDSALNVLHFLQNSPDKIPGLNEVIHRIEQEKATKVSLK